MQDRKAPRRYKINLMTYAYDGVVKRQDKPIPLMIMIEAGPKKKETKLPDCFADHMRRLHSCLTSCDGIERLCSTFYLMWSWVCLNSFG